MDDGLRSPEPLLSGVGACEERAINFTQFILFKLAMPFWSPRFSERKNPVPESAVIIIIFFS